MTGGLITIGGKSVKEISNDQLNDLISYVSQDKMCIRDRRMASVYEQQLELCERHQQETELSTLHIRDAKHNMKNNLCLLYTSRCV